MAWKQYDNWSSVLEAAHNNEFLHYKAPLDYRPCTVRVVCVYKNKKIRLDPMQTGTDTFTADRKHLERFVWLD